MTESDSKLQKVTAVTTNNNGLQPPFSDKAESSGSAELSIKALTLYNNTQAGAKRAGVGALALTRFLIII